MLAIGNPFAVGQTVTHGIVSAVARTQVGITDYQFFIQTDAAINPGNSGGALVDLDGRLVGINTAIFSRSGGSQGIGFAIPANMVKVVVASARSGVSTVRRPWLGARLQAVTPEIAESLGLKRPAGALVASVAAASAAARAGLKTSDLIASIDGQAVEDPNAFEYRFATKAIGGSARLGVMRAGKEMTVNVALEAAPETAHDELIVDSPSPFQGAKIANLSPALADDLRLEPSSQGVVILSPRTASMNGTLLKRRVVREERLVHFEPRGRRNDAALGRDADEDPRFRRPGRRVGHEQHLDAVLDDSAAAVIDQPVEQDVCIEVANELERVLGRRRVQDVIGLREDRARLHAVREQRAQLLRDLEREWSDRVAARNRGRIADHIRDGPCVESEEPDARDAEVSDEEARFEDRAPRGIDPDRVEERIAGQVFAELTGGEIETDLERPIAGSVRERMTQGGGRTRRPRARWRMRRSRSAWPMPFPVP